MPKRFKLEEDFSSFYPEEPKCAIAAYPYMIFNFWSNVVGGIDQNRQILRDIVKSTSRKRVIFQYFFHKSFFDFYIYIHLLSIKRQNKSFSRPQTVKDLVSQFRLRFLDDEYLTIHWRYNKGDWYHGGCQKGKDRDKIC